ncbi:MAG: amino acid ABC transporter substrate-binding protein, partial [Nitrospinota bacterium]
VWAFQVQLSDTLMGPVMAKYALDQGWKKGVLLFGNTGSAISVERNLKVAYPAAGGTIVGDFIIEEDQPSYRAELQRILTAKPDVIFFEVGPKTAATLFREWFQMAPSSLRIQWFGTDFVNQSFIRQVGPDLAEGVLSLSRGPAESERYEAWKQKYYQINKTRVVKALSEYAYDALNIVALAIEAAGHVSREGIAANIRRISNPPGVKVTSFPEGAAALRAGKEIDYDGLTSPADFTDFGLVIGPYTVSQVQKGNLVRLKTLMPKVKLVETFATLPE